MTHVLTYERETQNLKFELKEYIHKKDIKESLFDIFSRSARQSYEERKQKDHKLREEQIRASINKKNKKIKDIIVKERQRLSKELLLRGIRFNEILNEEEQDYKSKIERELDYFYKMKAEILTDSEIKEYVADYKDDQENLLYNFGDLNYFRMKYQ